MRRLPFTDAFVDESSRGRRYLMGTVLAEARHLPDLRPAVVDLAVFERVHFNNESNRQKRRVLTAIAEMPISVFVVVCQRTHGVTEFTARAECLTRIVRRLQDDTVGRLVIESRTDDREDQRVLTRARQPQPPFVFEHRHGSDEPMLWVADAVTWACGAGPSWWAILAPVAEEIVEVRP